MSGIFGAAGRMCTAGSRLLVQNSINEAFTERMHAVARSIKVGDPMDPATQKGPISTQMGPISTGPQFGKTLNYIDIARSEGARCILGGKQADIGGNFGEPTIFTYVVSRMRIAQEEVFGTVLSVIGYEHEEEAIRIGNDIAYGLAAGVWTRNVGRSIRVSRALRVGTIWCNIYRTYSVTLPFGGMKRSGVGCERGPEGIEDFLQTSIMISTAEVAPTATFVPR